MIKLKNKTNSNLKSFFLCSLLTPVGAIRFDKICYWNQNRKFQFLWNLFSISLVEKKTYMRLESTRPASISNSFSSNQLLGGWNFNFSISISIFIIFFRRLESTPPPPTARTPGLHRFGLVEMYDIWHRFNPYTGCFFTGPP